MDLITQEDISPILTQSFPSTDQFISEVRAEVFGLLSLVIAIVGGIAALWIFINKMN